MTVSHVRSTRIDTGEIAEVLARSSSRQDAAAELGLTPTTLERMCREESLVGLYTALAERGVARRGKKRPPAPPPPRWAIIMRLEGQSAVRIWSVAAANETEALDVACCVVGRIAKREELRAVQEVAK